MGTIKDVVNEKLKIKLPEAMKPTRGGASAQRLALRQAKEERYWAARKSLRMWPIEQGNPRKAVQGFLLGCLGFEPRFLNDIGPITVVRVERKWPGSIQKEVVVTLASKEVQDSVRAAAHRLANYATPAGMRLEVPDVLQTNFRALENLDNKLKRKYKNLKRNVKLDDYRLDVVMDVKLHENADWSTILPENAIEAGKDLPDDRSGEPPAHCTT